MADEVTKLPNAKTLQALVRKFNETKGKTDNLNGSLAQEMKDAVDKHNVHAGAMKLIIRLQRYDAVRLMTFLSHFDDYREKIGLDKLAAPELPDQSDVNEKDENGKPKPMFEDGKPAAVN